MYHFKKLNSIKYIKGFPNLDVCYKNNIPFLDIFV